MNIKRTTKIATPGGYRATAVACLDTEECKVTWAVEFHGKKDVEHYNEMDVELYVNGTWLPYEETIQHRVPQWLEDTLWKNLFPRLGMVKEEEL